jgi:glucokinase
MLRTTKVDYRIGVDVGGTKMSAVLLNGERVIGEYALATPTDDFNKFLVMIGALLEPLFEQAKRDKVKIAGIGLGIPGAINDGKVIISPNVPCLVGVKIVEILTEKFGAEYAVKIDNDANCFALGEARIGAGKKFRNVYGLIVGTGIGGGWVNNGELYVGSHGAANEPGQLIIDYREKIGLEEAYHKLTQNNPRLVAEEAYQGDQLASQIFVELGGLLGVGVANIINLLDPEIVVIGGGASESSSLFLTEIKKTVKELAANQTAKEIKVVVSKLGKQAGAIGAALLIE